MSEDLASIARAVRRDLVRMYQRGSGIGSALSCVDILTVLYFDTMRMAAPDDPHRDRFILSKGHAAGALYAVLARKGFFDPAILETYIADGSVLTSHPERGSLPGIEVSTGSLGQGLPMGVGLALAARRDGLPWRVFVLVGDGELQEGSVWEAAVLGAALQLENLTVIVDANGLQGYGCVADLMPMETIVEKWRAFGWATTEGDGHDVAWLRRALRACPLGSGKPSALVARTVKGKGIAEMEGRLGWHYFSVPPQKLGAFLGELADPEPHSETGSA